jgi:hypothetical protein
LSTPPPFRPWSRIGQFVLAHQGLAVPLAYVALVLLGMFHMALYYWRFGVNVVAFAQPVDFLLSPLADVLVIVVSILPIFIFAGFARFDRWFGAAVRKKAGKTRTPEQTAMDERVYRMAQIGGTLLWIIAFSLYYSRFRAERVERGETRRVRVELANGERLGSARDSTVALIGTTSQYAFFYSGRRDSSTGAPGVTIVPVDNVARIDQRARGRRRR